MQFIAFRKFICTAVSALIPHKELRHRVRYALDPLNDRRCTAYFSRKYATPLAGASQTKETVNRNTHTEYIWQCWLQGRQAAPPIVDLCLRSVEKHRLPHQQIVVITEENYTEYVDIPHFIIKKRAQGKIADAQFSDLLRIYLLATYGGYWIDATCLLTAPIPDWIEKAEFFMYHSHGEFAYTLIQSCFIRAKTESYLIQQWKTLMTDLWKHENRLLHYFQLHLMFKAMITSDKRAACEYRNMPAVPEDDTHILFNRMKKSHSLSQEMIEEAARKSFIHKLTYKVSLENKQLPDIFKS